MNAVDREMREAARRELRHPVAAYDTVGGMHEALDWVVNDQPSDFAMDAMAYNLSNGNGSMNPRGGSMDPQGGGYYTDLGDRRRGSINDQMQPQPARRGIDRYTSNGRDQMTSTGRAPPPPTPMSSAASFRSGLSSGPRADQSSQVSRYTGGISGGPSPIRRPINDQEEENGGEENGGEPQFDPGMAWRHGFCS